MTYLVDGAETLNININIHNPTSSIKTVCYTGGSQLTTHTGSIQWSNAAVAISRITMKGQGSDNFEAGTNLTLYGYN